MRKSLIHDYCLKIYDPPKVLKKYSPNVSFRISSVSVIIIFKEIDLLFIFLKDTTQLKGLWSLI